MSVAYDRLGHEQDDETPTGHTPGPWRFDADEGEIRAGDPNDGWRICGVFGWNMPSFDPNAHLIAAAPSLLNALAWMVANCPLCSRDVRFVEGVMADGLRCGNCYRARQVLDKAFPS